MEFVDDYEHELPGVMYFSKSLPSKDIQDLHNFKIEGCKCKMECTEENNCCCVKRSGIFYKYHDICQIKDYTIQENHNASPAYECNENCTCSERLCGNKLVQYGPRKNLKVAFCGPDKGYGLFTLQQIREGNFVCEYAGEIITEEEAKKRYYKNATEQKMNYIFCIKEHFGARLRKTFIDPTYYGNIGRYINHNCEPNCKLLVVRINDTIPILGIFAKEDIKENTEITYDYGEGEPYFENNERYNRKKCFCNSQKCQKYLPFDVSLTSKE